MMRLKLFLLALLFPWVLGNAQVFQIDGTARSFARYPLEVRAFSDWVTREMYVLARVTIQDDGQFSLRFEADPDTIAGFFIRLSGAEVLLTIEPGKVYSFTIPATDPGVWQMNAGSDTTDRWYGLMQFEMYYNDYVLKYEKQLRGPQARTIVNQFAQEADSLWKLQSDVYVWQTAKYKAAYTQLALNTRSVNRLVEQHIQGFPVLYQHPEYMQFFENLYPPIFEQMVQSPSDTVLSRLVHRNGTYSEILRELENRKIFSSMELASLTLSSGIWHMYTQQLLTAERVTELVSQAAFVSPSLARIHRNIQRKLAFMKVGSYLPDIHGYTSGGNALSYPLKNERFQMWVFFESSNPEALAELLSLNGLAEKYRSELEVLAICIDCNFTMLDRLEQQYKLRTGLMLMPMEELDRFDLFMSFQAYLADKNGRIVMGPAPLPSEGLEDKLYNHLRKVAPRK